MNPKIELLPACQAFLTHWRSINPTDIVPSVDAWFAGLRADLAVHVYRAELTSTSALMLFHGSELAARRGRSVEGQDMFAAEPERRADGMRLLHQLALHPCGYVNRNQARTTMGRMFESQHVILPLRPAPGSLAQIVGFSSDFSKRLPKETLIEPRVTFEGAWLDVGAVVPVVPVW